MPMSLQLTFRGLPSSESLAELVRERASKLEHVYDRLTACHVVIEAPQRNLFHVHIDLQMPRHSVIVDHRPGDQKVEEDAYTAVGHAFDAARRQLLHVVEKQRSHG